jgi:hypothetical protein
MDNMGGLRKLYYIDADDFVSLDPAGNNLFELTLAEGATLTEIKFSQETGKISEVPDETDHGTLYNYEVSCIIPKCGPDNNTPFGNSKEKKLLLLGIDDNENIWLTGAPGSYFKIIQSGSTGTTAADINSRQLKISAALMTGSVFIVSPF